MSDIKELATLAWDRKRSYLNLREKFQDLLVFPFAGGMWRADRETIAFLSVFIDVEQITLEDIYTVPRQVNPTELCCCWSLWVSSSITFRLSTKKTATC